VDITEKLLDKHKQALENSPTKTKDDFGGYVNDLLLSVIEKDEFLRIFAPAISVIDIYKDTIYLKENKKGRAETIEVYLKNNELYCSKDNTDNCIHIKYAFAIPEIAKLNLRKP